jgi:hypothetical protein
MAIETSDTQQSRRPRHNPENNNPIDNGREILHSIFEKDYFSEFNDMPHVTIQLIVTAKINK